MAEAKYVVGDQRNGSAKLEISTAKRTFTGLTKEELLKYQDDPFWVRLRWTMFVLFWALWLCMLAGAVVIIVRAPKCPAPKEWHKRGPLVDLTGVNSLSEVEARLDDLKAAKVQGVFLPAALFTGDIYNETQDLDAFALLAKKATKNGIKIIVDVTANYVNKSHEWFVKSEASQANFTDYFVWANGTRGADQQLRPPNDWVSVENEPAWELSPTRQQYYLHHYSTSSPDLNFREPRVRAHLAAALRRWLAAGAHGFRLDKARQLLVDAALSEDTVSSKPGATHQEYAFWKHTASSDQPELAGLLRDWRKLARDVNSDSVLALAERVPAVAPYLEGDEFVVDLPAAGAVRLSAPADRLAGEINRLLKYWPAIKFEEEEETRLAAGVVSALLPATPLLTPRQIFSVNGTTWKVSDAYARAAALRNEEVIMNGEHNVTTVTDGHLLACIRWMKGSESYLLVWNPSDVELPADASQLEVVPAELRAHLSSDLWPQGVAEGSMVQARNVVVPPRTALIFAFTPVAEK